MHFKHYHLVLQLIFNRMSVYSIEKVYSMLCKASIVNRYCMELHGPVLRSELNCSAGVNTDSIITVK